MNTDQIKTEIQEAIGAHGAWKIKLRGAAIAGKVDIQPADLCRDDNCRLGIWLQKLPATTPGLTHMHTVRRLHTQFHQHAGQVASLILAGQASAALTDIESGTYATNSKSLATALMAWRKAI